MENEVILNDGLKTYDIKNKSGKLIGQFSFNPADIGIVPRYNKALENFEKFFSELEKMSDFELDNSIEEIEKKAGEFIDQIFNADISKNFFSIMGAFSLLENGQFFIENVLQVIGQVIQKETGERVKSLNKRIKKHTAGYYNG